MGERFLWTALAVSLVSGCASRNQTEPTRAPCTSGECTTPDASTPDTTTSPPPMMTCTTPGCMTPSTCEEPGDCESDSYCEEEMCVAYGAPGRINDPSCEDTSTIEDFTPVVQCRWEQPPDGDPFPDHVQVIATPVVADLDLDRDASTLAPSLVFPSHYDHTKAAVIRVIDGATCQNQHTIDARVSSLAPVALGDLDGDGRAEIVASRYGGGLFAYRFDPEQGEFIRLWTSRTCAEDGTMADDFSVNGTWAGPSIYDLDDDGEAEVLYGMTVYGSDGCRLTAAAAPDYAWGVIPVAADVDADGQAEVVTGLGPYEFDRDGRELRLAAGASSVGRTVGQVAVADFGDFADEGNGPPQMGVPEIVVVSGGRARVQTLSGRVVFGPVVIPGGGHGGAPTVADFDGDGHPEFATAGARSYVVFDLDCMGESPEHCADQTRSDGILWMVPADDDSSHATGSSVFDFDADGRAEVVYGDECYLRIYDGRSGQVRFSIARSSGTTYESPVIADVDGDYHTEIAFAANDWWSGLSGCTRFDPLYPLTPFDERHGVIVIHDSHDRWASSRPVWNQHAYSVDHVGDRGETIRSSEVAPSWEAHNSFRKNVQGEFEARGMIDLTVGRASDFECEGEMARFAVPACNRGTLPAPPGVGVAIVDGDGATANGSCSATTGPLAVGECATLSCTIELDPMADFSLAIDPANEYEECREDNNRVGLSPTPCDMLI